MAKIEIGRITFDTPMQKPWQIRINEELEKLYKIERFVSDHRKEVMITCSEDCWCWELEAILNGE